MARKVSLYQLFLQGLATAEAAGARNAEERIGFLAGWLTAKTGRKDFGLWIFGKHLN